MTTKASLIDLNGNEMILDADGDTSITADTDDQINIRVGGTDAFNLLGSKFIIGDTASHVDDLLQIETPASGGGHGIQIRRNDSNTDQGIGRILFGNNTDTDLATISAKTDGANDSGAITFSTQATGGSSSEKARLSSAGYFGIGDSGPSTKLSVLDSSTVYARIKCSSASNAAVLELHSSDGTGMDFVAYGTSATGTVFGGLHDRVSAGIARNVVDVANRDTIIGTSSHRFIEFVTSDVGRLRVTASGSSYGALHYTSDYGRWDFGALNTGYHHIMAQTGPSKFYFNVRAEASGGFHTYSDENLKKDITTVTGALDSVAKMKGVTFKWKDAANRGGHDTGKQFGVTAQNMLEVDAELPSLDIDPLYNAPDKDGNYFIDGVKEDDKYYTMDYSRLTPFFIEAIKELKTKLEAAEDRIATLEGGE